MSTLRDLKAYRFTRPAHWQAGLWSRLRLLPDGSLAPVQPLGPVPRFTAVAGGASAPAFSAHGAAYWLAGAGLLQWREPGQEGVCSIEASADIGTSPKLAAGRRWLWAFSPGTPGLLRHDLDTFQLDPVAPAEGAILDLAGDGEDGVWLLLAGDGDAERLGRVDAAGRAASWALPPGLGRPAGLAYLSAGRGRLAFLSADGAGLALLDLHERRVLARIALDRVLPGFKGCALDSDRRDRLVVLGQTGQGVPGKNPSAALLLDASGGLLEALDFSQRADWHGHLPLAGAAAWGSTLLLATARGLLWFEAAAAGDAPEAEGVFLSPLLFSPETGSLRGWLRAELLAGLPKGATLSVAVLGTDDPALRDAVAAVLANPNLPPADRMETARGLLQAGATGPYLFDAQADAPPAWFAAPLFDRRERWLWLELRLGASPEGRLPALRELRVLYPEVTLAEHVPAIFRGGATVLDPASGDPTGFFRQLVGILETTTQGMDQAIARLGSLVDPATAPTDWLDFIARWLDLPWDDALPESVKRTLLSHAGPLLAQRGTRAGLATLLGLLLPWGAFKITDVAVDVGFALLGGGARKTPGARLPALLAGLPADAAALSRKAVLGRARLSCPDADPTGADRFTGLLRVELSAPPAGREAVEALLPALVAVVLPAGLRVDIRWREGADIRFDGRLGEGYVLDGPGPRRLGQDARLGQTALAPGRRLRLTETGLSLGFRLK